MDGVVAVDRGLAVAADIRRPTGSRRAAGASPRLPVRGGGAAERRCRRSGRADVAAPGDGALVLGLDPVVGPVKRVTASLVTEVPSGSAPKRTRATVCTWPVGFAVPLVVGVRVALPHQRVRAGRGMHAVQELDVLRALVLEAVVRISPLRPIACRRTPRPLPAWPSRRRRRSRRRHDVVLQAACWPPRGRCRRSHERHRAVLRQVRRADRGRFARHVDGEAVRGAERLDAPPPRVRRRRWRGRRCR